MSEKETELLGKKRDKEEEEEEEKSKNSKSKNDDSSEEDTKPIKSIFGTNSNNEKGFTKGLFGNLSNPSSEPKSLFGNNSNSLFGSNSNSLFNKNSNSLFGNTNTTSIFGSNNSNSLFGNNNSTSLFENKPIFDFSNINKKNENEENEENNDNNEEGNDVDDNNGKSNSPNYYNPENDVNDKENENGFKKIYVKRIDNFYLFEKSENKYISRGNGFVSIETSNKDNKKFAVIMFRNNIGSLICEGILNKKINKFDSYEKKFKHIGHCVFLRKVVKENNEEDIEFSQCKIPFINENDVKQFGDKYNEAIKFINE